MKRICVFVLAAALGAGGWPVRAAEQAQLDSDITLFTVLAAANVAGYDAGADSSSGSPVRMAVRDDLKKYQGPSLGPLKTLYEQHKQSDAGQDLAQYVSLALQLGPPPEFKLRVPFTDLSPDAQAVSGLVTLLGNFYREADIGALFAKYQPQFDSEIERHHEAIVQAVWETNGYLRMATSGYLGRRFQIYIDLLGAPNGPSVRGYGADVFVVLHPSKELHTREIRHAYLHYLLDPMAGKYAKEVDAKKSLGGLAMFAPALDESYKTDFALLLTESLIKAAEARMRHGNDQQKQAEADQALREGYLLAPHFYEQLRRFEVQDQGLRFYYPEMIKAIDLKKEDQRLRQVTFLERRPDPKPRSEPLRPVLTGAEKMLADAEDSFRRNQVPEARRLFEQVQEQTQGKDARALYGLARVAAIEKDPERAKELFRAALDAQPDPHVKAMSHLYLGRIEDLFGSREQAVQHYQEALAAGDNTPGTREAAEKGLKAGFASPRPN